MWTQTATAVKKTAVGEASNSLVGRILTVWVDEYPPLILIMCKGTDSIYIIG